jgi:hypothetical protein
MSWESLGLQSPWRRKGYATLQGPNRRPNPHAAPARRRKKRQLLNGSASRQGEALDHE